AFRAIARNGYGCTLDYAKAYDLMNPECTVRLMESGGFPPWICTACRAVWSAQVRFVTWAGTVHGEALIASSATAQGDPFGPLALQLWMASGLRHVQERIPPEQAGTDKVYMDDRSFSAPTPDGLLRKKEIWAEWSQRVGLRESEDKAQFFASNGQTASRLRARVPEPERVSHSGDILGCAAAFVARGPTPKELGRVAAAKRVTLLLGALRVTWARFHLLVRLFAISKACYGWMSRLPTLSMCQGIWSAIRAGHNTMLVANKDLRAMVMGGHCHLDIVAAIQLMRVVVALRKAGLAAWDDPKGSAVSTLRAWMLEHGWVVHTEWTWSAHNFADLGVDLTQADSVVFTVVAHRFGWIFSVADHAAVDWIGQVVE
ncbi:unnamed protein product, partial [Effrenium voratum]